MRVPVNPPPSTRPGPPSSSPPSATLTTSASTRTPGSPTSPCTAPTPSTGSRCGPGTAAGSATSPATDSPRSSSARPAPTGPAPRRSGPGHVRDHRRRYHRTARGCLPQGLPAARRTAPERERVNRASEILAAGPVPARSRAGKASPLITRPLPRCRQRRRVRPGPLLVRRHRLCPPVRARPGRCPGPAVRGR